MKVILKEELVGLGEGQKTGKINFGKAEEQKVKTLKIKVITAL